MYVIGLELSLNLYGSFSLKDKRQIIRSIIERTQSRLKISAAETGQLDVLNRSQLGFAICGNNYSQMRLILINLMNDIEQDYPVVIESYSWYEAV